MRKRLTDFVRDLGVIWYKMRGRDDLPSSLERSASDLPRMLRDTAKLTTFSGKSATKNRGRRVGEDWSTAVFICYLVLITHDDGELSRCRLRLLRFLQQQSLEPQQP